MDYLEALPSLIWFGLMKSLYRVLARALAPVRKKEENSICHFLQEEEEARERQKDEICLLVSESSVSPFTFHLLKGGKWDLSRGRVI